LGTRFPRPRSRSFLFLPMGERKRQVLVIDDQEEAAEVQLVAVNGYARPEDRRLAADAGFDAHLAKPIDLDVLERMLARDAPNI
jgi:hypothetical protein